MLYKSCFFLFSNSFLLSQRALGKGLVLSWLISHSSLFPTRVGPLGWTWAPDAISCLAALMVTSPIPGVPSRQWAEKEYDQPRPCHWTQITAIEGVAQRGGSSRPAGLTQEGSKPCDLSNCHHVTCLASQCFEG